MTDCWCKGICGTPHRLLSRAARNDGCVYRCPLRAQKTKRQGSSQKARRWRARGLTGIGLFDVGGASSEFQDALDHQRGPLFVNFRIEW